MSPPATSAAMHLFETFLIDRDMQARKPSLPSSYFLQKRL
jgi:hypothetical protein